MRDWSGRAARAGERDRQKESRHVGVRRCANRAILPFGYPVDAVGQGKKKRKSLSEVAHRDRFGQPYS